MHRLTKTTIAVAIAVAAAAAVTAAVSAERPKSPPFRIEIEVSGNDAQMRCTEGCDWETTSITCNGAAPCAFILSEKGVSG
jgi:hypothetical protein